MKKGDLVFILSAAMQAAILSMFGLRYLSFEFWLCMLSVIVAYFAGVINASKEGK